MVLTLGWWSIGKADCVKGEYQHHIAMLQERYHLTPATGPIIYVCDGNPGNHIVVTFYQTDPPTLIAEYSNSTSLMHLQVTASGAKYQGRKETFWEHHGEALVVWGEGAAEMRCKMTTDLLCPEAPNTCAKD